MKTLHQIIDKHDKIVILSGAGISTLSGINSFRGKNGLYNNTFNGHQPEEILSRRFFKNNSEIFWKFFHSFINISKDKLPNKCHFFAQDLFYSNKLLSVVTQNIDDLYEKTKLPKDKINHIHGTLDGLRCTKCKEIYPINKFKLNKNHNYISDCCNFLMESTVILYEDGFDSENMIRLNKDFNQATLLIVMGTNLDIIYHKDNVILFNGEIVLINDTDIKLESYAGMREWDYKFIGDFKDIDLEVI